MDIWASPVRIFITAATLVTSCLLQQIRKFHGIHVEKLSRRIHYICVHVGFDHLISRVRICDAAACQQVIGVCSEWCDR